MNLRLFVICFFLAWPCLGRADTLTFFDSNDQQLLQVTLPASVEVTDSSEGAYFATSGVSDVYGDVSLAFGSSAYFAQLLVAGTFGLDYFTSAQLYSGDETTPTLLQGSYDLDSAEGLPYTLLIQKDVAATPEPASLLLCGTGFSLLCFALSGGKTLRSRIST